MVGKNILINAFKDCSIDSFLRFCYVILGKILDKSFFSTKKI